MTLHDTTWSIEFGSVFSLLVAKLYLCLPWGIVFSRQAVVASVDLTDPYRIASVSSDFNISVSVLTFHHRDQIHSSKLIGVLHDLLSLIIFAESRVSDFLFRFLCFFWLSFFLLSCWGLLCYWFFYWASLLWINHSPERNWSWASDLVCLSSLFRLWSSCCLLERDFFCSSILSNSAEFEAILWSKALIESTAHWKSLRLFWVSLSSPASTKKQEIRTKVMIDSVIVKIFFDFSVILIKQRIKRDFIFEHQEYRFQVLQLQSLWSSLHTQRTHLCSAHESLEIPLNRWNGAWSSSADPLFLFLCPPQ